MSTTDNGVRSGRFDFIDEIILSDIFVVLMNVLYASWVSFRLCAFVGYKSDVSIKSHLSSSDIIVIPLIDMLRLVIQTC